MLPRSLLLCTILGIASVCGGQTVPEPQFEGSLAVPKYEGGYVLDWDSPAYTKFTLYGLDTKALYSLPLRAGNTLYGAWAADVDGVAARGYHGPKQQGKLDVLDISGNVMRTIDTGSYFPTHVTFAPDRTIWTLGYVSGYERLGEDFNVLRHYARTGEELGQALPWSQLAGEDNACGVLALMLGGRLLFSASDRIGFRSFAKRGRSEWIEVSFAGNVLGEYDLGSYGGDEAGFSPVALTASGGAYARVEQYRRFKGYAVLDRSKGIWREITGYPKGRLIGADGDNLVFSQLDGAWTVIHEVASAALPVKQVNVPQGN